MKRESYVLEQEKRAGEELWEEEGNLEKQTEKAWRGYGQSKKGKKGGKKIHTRNMLSKFNQRRVGPLLRISFRSLKPQRDMFWKNNQVKFTLPALCLRCNNHAKKNR